MFGLRCNSVVKKKVKENISIKEGSSEKGRKEEREGKGKEGNRAILGNRQDFRYFRKIIFVQSIQTNKYLRVRIPHYWINSKVRLFLDRLFKEKQKRYNFN